MQISSFSKPESLNVKTFLYPQQETDPLPIAYFLLTSSENTQNIVKEGVNKIEYPTNALYLPFDSFHT